MCVTGYMTCRCDDNSDGKIDYTEFIKYLTNYRPPHYKAMPESLNADTYSGKTQVAMCISKQYLQLYIQNKDDSESECMGGEYQTSTHFYFGDSLEPSSSVYNHGELLVISLDLVYTQCHAQISAVKK